MPDSAKLKRDWVMLLPLGGLATLLPEPSTRMTMRQIAKKECAVKRPGSLRLGWRRAKDGGEHFPRLRWSQSRTSGRTNTTRRNAIMSGKKRLYEVADLSVHGLRTKTLDMCVAVTDRDLEEKIKRAFDLAKSAGRELDLTFNSRAS